MLPFSVMMTVKWSLIYMCVLPQEIYIKIFSSLVIQKSWKVGFITYHINSSCMHLNAYTKQEGKQEFMFLKQTAAHIRIQAEGEVVVDVLYTFWNLL